MMKKSIETINVHTLGSVRLKSFWAMHQLENESTDRFTPNDIANYLINECKINTSRQAVKAALSRCRGSVHKTKRGFKLMEKGLKELLFSDKDEVFFIESGKPFSSKSIQLSSIFKRMNGEIKICDPYVDSHTLDLIFRYVDKSYPVKILSQKINDKPSGMVKRVLKDLEKEGYTVELRTSNTNTLHDRYFLDKNNLWLSGNSLNHLGSKESFIVLLGKDFHKEIGSAFNSKWNSATVYQ